MYLPFGRKEKLFSGCKNMELVTLIYLLKYFGILLPLLRNLEALT